jgi:hypothetical protein
MYAELGKNDLAKQDEEEARQLGFVAEDKRSRPPIAHH